MLLCCRPFFVMVVVNPDDDKQKQTDMKRTMNEFSKMCLLVLLGTGLGACNKNETIPAPEGNDPTPYVTAVLDYRPAVGQFTNLLPRYEAGDTQQTMNAKALALLAAQSPVTLGGYGGYIVVGFDHRIENKAGLCDFRVLGNSFYSNSNPAAGAPAGGSSEPGIIQVACDLNGNGLPDDDEWYEIAGSAHRHPDSEAWYGRAAAAGNDVALYTDYTITYHRPSAEPDAATEEYIRWEDNQGNSGYKAKNSFHLQSYYPQWIDAGELTFRGTRLPQNGVYEQGETMSLYVLYKFRFGYADNALNTEQDSAIDIDWAVDAEGRAVSLPGVDFIRIYTGVNQENGPIGECSTEIVQVEDLHLMGETIASRDPEQTE